MTYGELYRKGKDILLEAGVPEAELDARLLLEYVCGTGRSDLLVHGYRTVCAGDQTAYENLLAGRRQRIPLQHLTGVQEFMGLEFEVNGSVLIPRQDTEILVEEVLRDVHDGMRILDMCTGSGCILISLLHYTNDCEGVGADISAEALAVAERNAGRLLRGSASGGMPSLSAPEDRQGMVSFIQGDLFENVEGKFDVIVSNPPYIRRDVIDTLMPEVRDHEPLQALDGGGDGLIFYRRITEACREHLFGGGMLYFEIGYDQGGAVRELMEQAGFTEIRVVKDYAGLDRVVCGTLGFGWNIYTA